MEAHPLSRRGALLALALGLWACSPSPIVSVVPATATLAPGRAVQFTGVIGGMHDAWVTYAIAEGDWGGTIDESGLYVAPEVPGRYTVRVTSVADPTRFAVATVVVTPRPPISVEVFPNPAAVGGGGTLGFTAVVHETDNSAVEWSVEESGGGRIDAQGVYTAPPGGGIFHVRATSVADRGRSARVTVTVEPAVRGIRQLRYLTEDGVEERPADLRTAGISAVVLDGSGGSYEISAVGSEDGTFYIPNVPAYTGFFLKLPGNRYVWSYDRNFDLSEYIVGRPEIVPVPGDTQLTVNLDGMRPWGGNSDHLKLFAAGAGLRGVVFVPAMDFGGTEWSAVYPWEYLMEGQSHRGAILPTDQVILAQVVSAPANGALEWSAAVSHALITDGVRMGVGDQPYLGGTLSLLPPRSLDLILNRSSFFNAALAVSPVANQDGIYLSISTLPPSGDGGLALGTGLQLFEGGTYAANFDQSFRIDYGDLLPGWTSTLQYSALYSRSYFARAPDGQPVQGVVLSGEVGGENLPPPLGLRVIGAQVTPPQNVSLNGSPISYDTSTFSYASLSWSPPWQGGPNYYSVIVHRIDLVEGNRTALTRVGTFTTPTTWLSLPRGTLQSGSQYAFTVRAVASSSPYHQPYITRLPVSYADALSGTITVTGL